MDSQEKRFILSSTDPVLITGAAGFIGTRVVRALANRGYRNLTCFVRSSMKRAQLAAMRDRLPEGTNLNIVEGNLLRPGDCETACHDAVAIVHLAAGTGEKSFPDAFMNSVVTTRNLLEAGLKQRTLKRFVLVSSFSVYTNCDKPRSRLLDESCPLEEHPELRGDAYCFAKLKQEQLVAEYGRNHDLPYVIVRPGSVYGEGHREITGRVGISTFGPFFHLAGANKIPFTHVENCADAIALAAVVEGVDKEVFNIVDDDAPSSRRFLRHYKQVVPLRSVYIPHAVSYLLCWAWEKYSIWSQGQLPLAFNRKRWHAFWKKTGYSNDKLKAMLGWRQTVPTSEAMRRYFQSLEKGGEHA